MATATEERERQAAPHPADLGTEMWEPVQNTSGGEERREGQEEEEEEDDTDEEHDEGARGAQYDHKHDQSDRDTHHGSKNDLDEKQSQEPHRERREDRHEDREGDTKQEQKKDIDKNRLPDSYFKESLIQKDNTGTRKYRNLLRGLKTIITKEYEPTDVLDIMPQQLKKYYEDLHGDYHQLFLYTPNPSIAFIYKSLGCSYSLQPIPRAEKVEEPEVPALKTEGWIMWSTIQMLLGPDEHAGFLIEAVKKWDVIDPETGKIFPKTLPRDCFPAKPDPNMLAWYEGVSERLKKEAEEEAEARERQQEMERHAAQHNHRRIAARGEDEEDSVDSRGPALEYFRNPLYRRVDGRPTIVRKRSRRPSLSPRHSSLKDKSKEAVSTVGHVIRNVASPHLWDGEKKDRRRRSVPDNRYHHPSEPAPPGVPYDARLPGPGPQEDSPRLLRQRRRGPSSQDDREHLQPDKGEKHSLKHSRSHEPTPSQREYDDYFQQGMPLHSRHSSVHEDTPPKQPAIGPSFGPSSALSFAAQVAQQSSRPRQQDNARPYSPKDRRARFDEPEVGRPPGNRSRSRFDDRSGNDSPRRNDQQHHHHHHHRSRSSRDERRGHDRPNEDSGRRYDDSRDQEDGRSYKDQHRPDDQRRYEGRGDPGDNPGGRHGNDDRRGPGDRRNPGDRRSQQDRRGPENRRGPDDRRASGEGQRPQDRRNPDDRRGPRDRRGPEDQRSQDDRSRYDDASEGAPDPRRTSGGHRRSASRRSGDDDFDDNYSDADDRDRGSGKKQARFATAPIAGVGGRTYMDQSPWKSQD